MMIPGKLITIYFVFCLALGLASCSNNPPATGPQPLPDPPPFNPDYFRSSERYYYAVKINYKNQSFVLDKNVVYKLPGRAMNLKKFPSGNFGISYLDASGNVIDELSTASPLKVLKETGGENFLSSSVILLDSVSFYLPLHASNKTQRIRIKAHSFSPVELMVPHDTLDVIVQSQNMVPDSLLLSGKYQN